VIDLALNPLIHSRFVDLEQQARSRIGVVNICPLCGSPGVPRNNLNDMPTVAKMILVLRQKPTDKNYVSCGLEDPLNSFPLTRLFRYRSANQVSC